MTNWRKLAVGAVLALAVMPWLMVARTDATANPHPEDFTFISLEENPSRLDPSENVPTISVEKSGTIPAKEGMRLRVNADPGNIHIFTDESTRVSYCVRIEADSREPGAEAFVRQFTVAVRQTPWGISLDGSLPWRTFHGQFGVSYEIHIPRRSNIEIHTLGGNIDLQDIEGQVDLFTEWGNITAGRVDAGKTSSRSLYEHAGRIAAKLETMGGHIAIGDVAGTLRASTPGGHITAGTIGGGAILHTGGGKIRTGRISGVGMLDTGGGNITAWLNDGSSHEATEAKSDTNEDAKSIHKPRGASQFLSNEGDVVVYIPREMAATIDAVIGRGGGHRIVADPALPQRISCQDSGPGLRTIRCVGDLNGGGEVLHLKAVSGNIILKLCEPRTELSAASPATWMETAAGSSVFEPQDSDEPGDYNDAAGFFAEVRRRILESWWGGVPVDAAEMQKHLEHAVSPVYPDVARKAGIEGDVVLRICVSGEGRVTDLKVLDGPPILARAAVEAVQQWQYHALKMNGRPAAVVTTMIVSFRLH